MVIVPEATQSMRPAEPLVQLQLAEFVRLRERMQALDLSGVDTDRRNAKLLAMNLCDTSREIVFRLHRITRKQLSQLIAEFHEAARIIEIWPLKDENNISTRTHTTTTIPLSLFLFSSSAL